LRRYVGKARRLIGIDVVPFTEEIAGVETYNANLARLPLETSSVDVIMSRSVFETSHGSGFGYREFARCAPARWA
jgi:hypothetical protein